MKKTLFVIGGKTRFFLRLTGWVLILSSFALGLCLYGATFGVVAAGCLGVLCWGAVWLFAAQDPSEDLKGRLCLQRSVMLLLCFFVVSFVYVQGLIYKAAHDATPEDARYLIVLGAAVRGDQPSFTLASRLDTALLYLKTHPETAVVVSGGLGRGKEHTEAAVMKRYLIERGIAESRISEEAASTTTWENLRFSKRILEKKADWDGGVMIVTSDYHQFRARYIAARLGLQGSGLSVESKKILYLNYAMREYFALLKTAAFEN